MKLGDISLCVLPANELPKLSDDDAYRRRRDLAIEETIKLLDR